jgi:hypothetical protein
MFLLIFSSYPRSAAAIAREFMLTDPAEAAQVPKVTSLGRYPAAGGVLLPLLYNPDADFFVTVTRQSATSGGISCDRAAGHKRLFPPG